MADDDLLLTNNYTKNTSNGDSNKEVFSKLMNSKNTSQNVYNRDTPEFTKNLNPDQNIGVGINENSVAFEQFLKIAQTDKKKKIKKTIMNIDSRNRTKTYTFDSLNVKYTGDSPLSFVTNATEFELSIDSNAKTHAVNYIDDTKFFNQLILSNLNVNEFSKLGITKDSFEFSVTKGAPIFDILQFIYDEYDNAGNLTTTEYNSFDNSKQKYRYNRLVLNLPSNIEPKELQTMRLGKDVDINIITNVNISYPTPSHYFINLGRTFSNVYSVSLISSEIPNTSYTFNENLVESNFGQFKLTTKQNNKLRWINKTDRVNVATNSLHMATLFHENMPVLPSVPASKLHNDHFKKIVNLYNCNINDNSIKAASKENINIKNSITTIDTASVDDGDYFILKDQLNTQENGVYKKTTLGVEKIVTNDFIESNGISFIFLVSNGVTNKGKYFLINKDGGVFSFTEIDYVENLRRLHSLIRVSHIKTTSIKIPLKSRDYYFNSRYLGNFVNNNNKIIGIKQNTTSNISDTVFTSNESMISNIEKDLNGFYTYRAVVNKSDSHSDNNTYSHIKKFTDFEKFELELYSANTKPNINDYVAKTLMNLELPFKIIFQKRYKGSGDNSFITYIFNVTKITENTIPDNARLKKKYTFNIVPINSNITTDIYPFHDVTDGKIQFTVYNSIPHNILFNYQKYYPDIWDKLQSYYITSEVGLIKSVPQLSNHYVQLSYSALDSSKDPPISEVTGGSASPHIMKYLLEFKTYYSYNFVNTVLNKQVETVQVGGVNGGYYLFIFFKDANADTVSEISSVAKDYSYVKVNNNFYELGSDITYNISTNKFKIQIIPVNNDIKNIDIISDVTTTVTVSFQKLNYKELKYVYIKSADQHQDLSNKIVRFNLKNKEDYNFIEYYFSGKVETTTVGSFNVHKYEVRYKFKPELSTIDLLDYKHKKLTLFDEKNRTYMRNYIGNFIVTKYDNDNTDGHDLLSDPIEVAYSYSNSKGDIVYKSTENSTNFLEYFEDNITNKKLETDIIDIPSYQVIAITNKSVKNGISSISFAKEFIETEEQTALIVNPKINSDTNKIPSQLNMSLNNTSYKAIDNRTATKYPVYELNISSGKYSADSIVKYMLGALNNLKSRVYDYSKGIFYNDSSFQKFIDLNNEFGINQESKFVIEVDKSVNSISFKQYKKIFDSHKNTSVIKGQIVYYNEGFPFVYFNIPQVSLPNNSLVYMAGGGSIGNMGGDVTRGESNVVVPLNFRVRIRQLLPLPKIDSVNSNANLFAKEGYADVEDNEIYNKFVDYINNAVKSDNVKDISTDYIVDQIFGLNESGYIDLNNLSEDKLTNLKEQFTSKGLPKNSANMTESELNKSFVDNYGKNTKYKSVQNFNNQSENTFSYNRTGLEYYGQALINGYKNEQSYREYFDAEKEPEDYETYGDDVSSGFETTFIQNELFMRLSDTNVTNKKNIIGRFTKVSEQSDKYGNIVGDYDLFSDNYLNFKIGDIIIGLDSNTIGVILPYDYKYNSLPNNDLVALGAGAYLMNKSVMDAGSAFEKYVSVTDSSKGTRELAKKFISNINNWQIERNKTNRGFYVYSSTTPNSSKLGGSKLPNFQLYVPRFFKFLEDTDTALDKFGLKNKENNSKFNYFKTNYEPNHEVSIKRSFFNIAKNNEIFTDYLIFETKSTDNFSVNDRVYIEDHSIISKGADFKREKFFNVELLENYASFISKLETIYNTTVQNYNGLSGIGKTSSDDETYLYDNEYKYDDAPGNSTARGTVTLEAALTKFVINEPGKGYTGSPLITIDNTFQVTEGTATATVKSTTGAVETASVTNSGKYSSIPKIIIENPSIIASLSTNTGVLGQIELVNITDPGFGYTQVPIITAPASSGIQSIGLIELSGIGSVDFRGKDNLANLYSVSAAKVKTIIPSSSTVTGAQRARIDIIFSDPSAGTSADAAEGYIEYEVTGPANNLIKTITSIIITKSGSKYSPIERISMFHVINWHPILTKSDKLQYFESSDAIGTNFNVIVNAIGNVVISTGGTKYYINDVYSSDEQSQQSGNVFIDNNISNAIVKCEGNPNITILDPSNSGSGAILTPIILNGVITSIQVVHGGSGYSNLTTLTIDVPRALFKSALTTTGRINNVSVLYSPSGYSNSTTLTVTNPKETALGTINYLSTPPPNHELIIINNKGKGYLDGGTSSEISGFNGNIITTISKGEIQRIELELNNYEFAVNETPLIVIPNSNNSDFATLSVYKSNVGQIIMKRKYQDLDTNTIKSALDLKKNTDPSTPAAATASVNGQGVITTISMGSTPGAGYNKLSPPAIIIAPPFITATAIATVSGGVITGIEVAGGIGYRVPPNIQIAAPSGLGTGTAATAEVTVANGSLTITSVNPGSGYTAPPKITIVSGTGTSASITATINTASGAVPGSLILVLANPGVGYSTPPVITVAAPFITATATASVKDGIVKIDIFNGGAGYVTIPKIQIDAPNIQATATATLATDGTEKIKSIDFTNSGAGYTVAPKVTIEDPVAGTPAQAKATLTADGKIGGIAITNSGTGYTVAPLVTIDLPTNITATATAQITDGSGKVGMISSIVNISGGGGYSSTTPPVITIDNDNSNFYNKLGLVSGPSTNIPNKIHKIEINTNTWGTLTSGASREPFKFTSPPDIYVYKLTSAQSTDTTLIPAAKGLVEQNGKVYIQSSIPEVVTVKAVIENGTILSCVPDQTQDKISSDSVVIFNSPDRRAELSAEIQGTVKSISIDNSGNNYDKTVKSISIDIDPPNITAEAISVVDSGGTITRIDITNPGAGYSSITPPVITVAAPFITATTAATVSDGVVTGITITSGGGGYSSITPPVINVGAPPLGGVQATAVATVSDGVVTGITITSGGGGYSPITPPVINVGAPPSGGVQAAAVATVSDGVVTGITINSGGGGYSSTTPPVITVGVPPLGGVQATAVATVSDGVVTGITINSGGSGYSSITPPVITVAAPFITATAKANVVNGNIISISIETAGSGYTRNSPPSVTIQTPPIQAPPSATAEAISVVDSGGTITRIDITNPGVGYSSLTDKLPVITVAAPFITATATATVDSGGVVTDIKIDSGEGGTGYSSTTPPVITVGVPPLGGVQATAVATVSDGVVTGITINSGGSGYSSITPPVITVAAPFITATAKANVVNGSLTITTVNPGSGYTAPPNITIVAGQGQVTTPAVIKATINTATGAVPGSLMLDLDNAGVGYSTPPVITVAAPFITATAKANVVNGNIISISIETAGSGYTRNSPPSVTIPAPSAVVLTKAEATSAIDNGRITTLTVTNIGAGYTNIPKLKVDDPPTIAKLPIPFKNKQIYRYFNQDIINFNKNYYLTYKTSQSQLVAGEFYISLSDKIINQLYIESAFDFIKTDLSIGDIRNNMCVITITNDSNQKITFTRSDIKNKFTSLSSIPYGFFQNTQTTKYHLNIKAYRLPIAVSETANFGDKSSDGSHKTQYISKYSTLGIFQRLLDEQINNIYSNMNYNIIKAAELYRTYSYNIFKNRIIKIKVCPIDEQGFSFENCNSTGSIAQETLVSNRQVKGYSKKLFPYHEYDVIQSYDKSEFGRDVNIIGTPYKSFKRPQQKFDNKETTSKAFLPGMGVYAINKETIINGTQSNNNHYNSTNTPKNINLFYSEYQYDTQFMGYVIGTSINSRQEYNRNYRLHSDNFSKLDANNSVHSEYYIYMLIDPSATTTNQIDELFNTLNTDNVNIVFDANAKNDYTNTALTQPGYVTSRNEFYINSSKNDLKTKSDDKQYSIPKNIYKQRCFMNEQNVLKFFEDESYSTEIANSNVDAFLGLTAASITINKPKLNKTLPYYNFQARLACATIVKRPVAYEKKNDIYSRKLFNSGDYDYFYKNYLENKTVMRYKSVLETRNIDNMNKHNMVFENPVNRNFKANNFKETDCHSSCLDPNINNSEDFFDIGNVNNVTEIPDGNKQILKFNNGEDIILVDAYKRKFSYESGDIDYSDIQGRGDKKLGIQHTHIKILTGSIIPPLFFNHNRLSDNKLNEYCNYVSILDHQYDSGVERLTYNNIVGKYKPDKIHIAGDNSNQYLGNDEDDMSIYNKVFVNDASDSNKKKITISNTIGSSTIIDSGNIDKLKDCLLILSTNIKCKNESQPIDDTNNTEMVLIEKADLLKDDDDDDLITGVKLTLKNELSKVHKTNFEEETGRSFIPYATVKTRSPLVYNNSSRSYSFEVANTEKHYNTLKTDDYILIDWGVQRDVIHSGTIPYKLVPPTNNSPNKTSLYTTATYKIDIAVNAAKTIKTVTIQNPRVLYPSDIRIIIMKNPFNTANNSTISNNFLSTQPFTINNEWYTRIFYKGASYNIGSHFDASYKKNNVLPNLDDNYVRGGTPLFNKNYSNTIYIGGMKGIKLPFLDINGATTFSDTYSIPTEDDFYEITPSFRDDFMTENNSSPIINNIQGEFTTRFNNINNISDFDNNPDINRINEAQWIDNNDNGTEYASLIIKGLYLGYGGFMEDRANQDTINTMINKSTGTAIKKIKQINNKFYIYIQLSKTYNNFFLASNLDESYNIINQGTRKTYLDYETNLHLLDEILDTNPESYEPYLSIFGKNGKMVRKVIKTPYDLNPNNYIYMVIPNLNHIKSIQNNEIEDAFAKILLPGESNKTLFSSFVAGTKIFYNNLFNNLNELEITFITNEGHLFDFNGSEHSFTIEITEIIDKLEYINPRFGNIEF